VLAGCLNGGGQLPAAKDQSAGDWLSQVEQAYRHPTVQLRQPQDDPVLSAMYSQWVQDKAKDLLHTAYHAREKSASVQVSDW
jgi:iron only hydrogenase large subunit-like protein